MFTINEEKVLHDRPVYGILDVLGDFGGVQYILYILGSYFLSGLSEFKFNLNAMKKLYYAKTSEKDLLRKSSIGKVAPQKNKFSPDLNLIKFYTG